MGTAQELPGKFTAPLAGLIMVGLLAASKGVIDIAQARTLAKRARSRHETELERLEAAQIPVHEQVAAYGHQQLNAVARTLGRFADWIERNQMSVNRLGHSGVNDVEVSLPELPAMKSEVKHAQNWLSGGIAGASAAAAAPSAAMMGVSAFATASTGTAISGLGGVAATNATLAWLGGGSIAAGGGGMAAGTVILNLIAIAPATFIGGITVAVVGSKQKTSAKVYAAEVEVAICNVGTAIALLPKISDRMTELSSVLSSLEDRANQAIDQLDSLDFDPDLHAADFAKVLQLVRAIREVVNTPILDEETGELTDVSFRVVRRYQ